MNALIASDFTQCDDPDALFDAWMADATAAEPRDPNAIALATVARDGRPDVRTVLLKTKDDHGFVFFTNAGSAKGEDLAAHAEAAFALYWKSLNRQIRVRGPVEFGADRDNRLHDRVVFRRDGTEGPWPTATWTKQRLYP